MSKPLEYLVTNPSIPKDAKSPVMDHQQMTDWLNRMLDNGWEYAGYGQTHWNSSPTPQEWWIFKK